MLASSRRLPLEIWGEHHFSIRLAPFRFLGRSSLIVSDPEAIHHCFVSNAGNYGMNPLRQAVLRPFLRDGLLTAEGEVWKTARKAVSPVFTPRKVNGFAPQIEAVCERAMAALAARDGETNAHAAPTRRASTTCARSSIRSSDNSTNGS